ncbi:uncharacterized protein LOC103986720 [Musa acuminata AAA Group]|uniref:uncharacterized protein LOC103986720 n=1 Tax=Musa acuminata AAA Group TaxID=214697 RepID=UPI0031D1A44A
MEVVAPVRDLHFASTYTSPSVSAPSSPKRVGHHFDFFHHYTSAPTSPSRASAIYSHFNAMDPLPPPPSAGGVPFDWEETPGTPKSRGSPAKDEKGDVFDFAFDFGDKEGLPMLTTADELFEEGKIRPLKPPPRLQYPAAGDRSSVASSPRARGLWSPRHRGRSAGGEEFDPFTAAMVEATKDRRRERTPTPPPVSSSTSPTLKSGGGGSKKWRLRDLLLFRSASEGRATGNRSKDPLRKYTLLSSTSSKKVVAEDAKHSSFRSTETPLPYRQGLFGCLRFNPAVLSISKGFGSHSFGRRR